MLYLRRVSSPTSPHIASPRLPSAEAAAFPEGFGTVVPVDVTQWQLAVHPRMSPVLPPSPSSGPSNDTFVGAFIDLARHDPIMTTLI